MFGCTRETVIPASPERVFEILADVERHSELAGSGEPEAIRLLTEGPVRVGTRFEADENIMKPRFMRRRFVAQSEVTRFEPPRLIEWRSVPPTSPAASTIWTYSLSPEGDGTRVHQQCWVRMDNPVLELLMLPFAPLNRFTRGKVVARGMEGTLANLTRMAAA